MWNAFDGGSKSVKILAKIQETQKNHCTLWIQGITYWKMGMLLENKGFPKLLKKKKSWALRNEVF